MNSLYLVFHCIRYFSDIERFQETRDNSQREINKDNDKDDNRYCKNILLNFLQYKSN